MLATGYSIESRPEKGISLTYIVEILGYKTFSPYFQDAIHQQSPCGSHQGASDRTRKCFLQGGEENVSMEGIHMYRWGPCALDDRRRQIKAAGFIRRER